MKKISLNFKRFRMVRALVIFLASMLVLGNLTGQAQNISVTQPCSNVLNGLYAFPGPLVDGGPVPAINITAAPGTPNITITALSYQPNGSGFELLYPGSPPFSSPSLYGLTFNTAVSTQVSLSGTFNFNLPPSGGVTATDLTINFTLRADDGAGNICARDYTMHVKRKPIDLIFVLDISGSMSEKAIPTCVSGCQTKIDALKFAVGKFFERGAILGNFDADDKVSVVYFETGVDNTDATLVSWSPASNITTLATHVNAKSLGNSTNLNGGLASAISNLTNSSRKQNVIVFTDGIQNVSPLVTSTGGADPTVTIGGIDFKKSTAPLKIYSIGLNAPSGAVYSTLQDIAHATNGIPYFNTDAGFTLDETFINTLITVLKGSSPQLIDYRSVNANGKAINVETFVVNKHVDKILLDYTSAGEKNSDATITVLKDSVDVTQFGTLVNRNGYKLFSMSLPKKKTVGDTIKSEGKWSLVIRNSPGGYKASAIVDDHALKYTCSVGDSVYTVGDTLNLKITMGYKGTPLTDASQITALVLKPGDDWGDLLANASVQGTPSGDVTGAGDAKGLALLSDTALYNKLLSSKQVVPMTNNGDGTYTGNFRDTQLTGPYRVVFLIKGSRSDIGSYVRTETVSLMVNFGNIDDAKSVKSHTWKGDTLILVFKPMNVYGKLMGPAYESRIHVTPAPSKVVDNLDGSYNCIFYNTPEASDPQITIAINGEEFYTGPASKFDNKPGCDAFYCHWWFWLLILILIIIIAYLLWKKKHP
jgi:hypothetical protein